MKQKLLKPFVLSLFLIPLCVVLIGEGCEKEEETICACGIENPLENIEWLQNILEYRTDVQKVYSFISNENEYILIEGSIGGGLMGFYNCKGDLKCEVGGAVGIGGPCDMPSNYWSDFEKNKKLIFKQ